MLGKLSGLVVTVADQWDVARDVGRRRDGGGICAGERVDYKGGPELI